jgi:hypothetical protein
MSDLMTIIRERPFRRGSIKIFLAIILCGIATFTFLSFHASKPVQHISMGSHPIETLIKEARLQFSETRQKQSRTLAEAVEEYKRRHEMHPPPNFDLWYAFAEANNVQMIDDYDTIQDLLKPFWGMTPASIRRNARESLGAEGTHLMGLLIRNGQVASRTVSHWTTDTIVEMTRKFVHHLPDMDLVFNVHDGPSVVIPHDLLHQLVVNGQKHQAISLQHDPPHDFFSERAKDIVDDIPGHYGTNILHIGHQTVWEQQITSCPLNSPVRIDGGTDLTSS